MGFVRRLVVFLFHFGKIMKVLRSHSLARCSLSLSLSTLRVARNADEKRGKRKSFETLVMPASHSEDEPIVSC